MSRTQQTPHGRIAGISARAKAEEIANKAKTETYFDLQRKKQSADPENSDHKQAVALGLGRARVFMDSLKNPDHPSHEVNLGLFRDGFGGDYEKCKAAFVQQACDEQGTHPYERQDPNRERAVLDSYRPAKNTTIEEHDMYNTFRKAVTDLWNRSGYRANEEKVKELAASYGLTRAQTHNTPLDSSLNGANRSDMYKDLLGKVQAKHEAKP